MVQVDAVMSKCHGHAVAHAAVASVSFCNLALVSCNNNSLLLEITLLLSMDRGCKRGLPCKEVPNAHTKIDNNCRQDAVHTTYLTRTCTLTVTTRESHMLCECVMRHISETM